MLLRHRLLVDFALTLMMGGIFLGLVAGISGLGFSYGAKAIGAYGVFGLVVALCDRGPFTWSEFRERLIAEIAAWERANPSPDASYRYYERWQAALETILIDKNLCPCAELDERERLLAARPAGHDH